MVLTKSQAALAKAENVAVLDIENVDITNVTQTQDEDSTQDDSSDDNDTSTVPDPPPTDSPTTQTVTLPTPTTTIAKIFADDDMDTQIKNAEEISEFLNSNRGKPDLNHLNTSTHKVPFLICVPDSHHEVRVVFGVGTGCGLGGLGKNPIDGHILALQGEHEEEVSVPTCLVLPKSILTWQDIPHPTNADFQTQLKSNLSTRFWFTKDKLQEPSFPTTAMIPIPSFLVYDAFHTDIDAAEVWQRITSLPEKDINNMKITFGNACRFLKATTVRVNKGLPTVQLEQKLFFQRPTQWTKKWQKTKVSTFLSNTSTTVPLPPVAQSAPLLPPTQFTNTEWSPENIIALLRQAQTKQSFHEEKKDDSPDTPDSLFGLSEYGLNRLLIQCGLSAQTKDDMSDMWKNLYHKKHQKSDKIALIRQQLQSTVMWKEARVHALHSLLNMVITRSFEGTAGPTSSLTSNASGLTIFAFPCMSELEIDSHNDYAEALDTATSTTVQDVTTTKTKASIPTTFDNMLKRIKRFANFVFAIFGNISPLFLQLEDIINDLDDYFPVARDQMTRQTMASILWIIHQQARHFSSGLMSGDNAILPQFINMCNFIRMRWAINDGSVPIQMYTETKKDSGPSNPKKKQPPLQPNPPDKRFKPNPNPNHNPDLDYTIIKRECYHPKLKQAMAPFANWPKKPMIRSLCRTARCSEYDLFPNQPKLCMKAQLYGQCYAHCNLDHEKISDEQADRIVKKLQPAFTNPHHVKVII